MFDLILADPPWRYDFGSTNRGAIENHYPTMPMEDLCAMRPFIDSLHNGNAILFMWTTAPKLPEGVDLIRAWGFKYKTCDVWVKVSRDKHRDQLALSPEMEPDEKKLVALGYYTRIRHEMMLIGTAGKFSPPPQHLRPVSAFYAERGRHSEKPQLGYERIEFMYPDAKRVELFARKPRDGWAHWGNELPTSIVVEAA